MHCLCVVAVLMYVYVLSLCSGSHVYRKWKARELSVLSVYIVYVSDVKQTISTNNHIHS